jgi:DNA primase
LNDIPRLLSILGIDAKHRGDEWIAKCPVHTDADPSWSINENGSWYCFGCVNGGGLGQLIETIYKINWQDAKIWLQENGITSEETDAIGDIQIQTPTVSAPPTFVSPPGCYFGNPEKWPTPVRRYVGSRGITEAQVARWQLGYALTGWLANRIIIPHFDRKGNMAGYSARTFIGEQPRYLTPKPEENSDFTVMFGMNLWEGNECVVVTEGSIDALACERAGAQNIAAFGGSPFASLDITRMKPPVTPLSVLASIGNLSRFKKILIATDPDKAGNKVYEAMRPLGRWAELSRVVMPEGMDAAKLENSILRELLLSAGMP